MATCIIGVMPFDEHHDDKTLVKVLATLERVGLDDLRAMEVITELLNAGILFRERVASTEPLTDADIAQDANWPAPHYT